MYSNQLYIHIGTHKTGSTTIQKVLKQNAQPLLKDNIVYLSLNDISKPLMNNIELSETRVEVARKKLLKEIDKNTKNKNTRFIWSTEALSGDPSSGYRNSNIIAESLKKITIGLDVYIIIYLRRQDNFLESLYTQMIHEGASYSFETFIDNFSPNDFDWKKLIDNYKVHFGKEKIIVRRYEKEFFPEENSLIGDFSDIIKRENLNLETDHFVFNRGYSRNALEIARILNTSLNKVEKKQLRHLLQQSNVKQPFENFSFWSLKERMKFMVRYEISNNSVAREYFNSDGLLFPSIKLKNESSIYNGLSIESTVIVLFRSLLKQQEITNSQREITNAQLNKINKSITFRLLWKIESSLRRIKKYFEKVI